MDWAMADERLKVELFRFVDVFPTLRQRRRDRPPPARVLPAARRRAAARAAPGDRRCRAALAAAPGRRPRRARRDAVVRAPLHRRPRRPLGAARPQGAARRAAWASRSTCSARPRSAPREAAAYQQRYLDLLDDLSRQGRGVARGARRSTDAAWGALPRGQRLHQDHVALLADRPARLPRLGRRRQGRPAADRAPGHGARRLRSTSTSSSSATATSPTPSSPSCSTKRSFAPTTRPASSCRPTCATRATTSRP